MLQSLLDQLFLRMDMAEVSWSVRLRILTQTLLDRTVPVGASQDVVTRMETIIDRLQDARPIVATLQEIIVAIGSNTSSTPFWLLLLRLVPRCSSDDLRDWICQRFRCHCINRAVLAVAQQCFADLPEESALAGVLREYQAIYEDETVGGGIMVIRCCVMTVRCCVMTIHQCMTIMPLHHTTPPSHNTATTPSSTHFTAKSDASAEARSAPTPTNPSVQRSPLWRRRTAS